MADRQKLQAAISLLCSFIHFLQDHRRVGAGRLVAPESVAIAEPAASVAITGQANAEIATSADDAATVSWNDVEAAFNNRIRTAIITNHRHLDFLYFMEDARHFIIQVQQAVEVHTSVKVNAILAAEYMIIKDDQETIWILNILIQKQLEHTPQQT